MLAQGLTSLLWFIAILALIPALLWLLKRTPAGARFSGAATNGAMRSISALPITATQRLLTVEVGQGDDRRWLVLGVTANSITTLHTMAPQADAGLPPAASAAASINPSPFAQLLGRLRREPGERP